MNLILRQRPSPKEYNLAVERARRACAPLRQRRTHIHVAPSPKKAEAMTGLIQWVRLAVHANQNRQTGKQNAAANDMGSLASGLILPPVSTNFSSKYSLQRPVSVLDPPE